MSPFGRRSVNDSRVIPANNTPTNSNSAWEDLDVPTFLRKKM
jgi:hypothetical protein